jgi:uncharacterized membrane protein YdjX (TVP38/TMEM64 family)
MKRRVLQAVTGVLIISLPAVLLMIDTGLWPKLMSYCGFLGNREWLHAALKASGRLGPIIFITIQTGQVLLAPIPGDVTGFLGGYLFGAWQGFLLSTVGLTIGSMLNFGIGRLLGERVARRLVRSEIYLKCNEMVQYKGILAIFLFFLAPGFPKDYLCLFLGLTSLPAQAFFILSTVGRIPGTAALSLQGASISEHNYMLFGVAVVSYILLAILAYLTRDPFCRWMARKGHMKSCSLND